MKVQALRHGADPGEAYYLVLVLEALSAFVSRIHAHTHSALLYEILGFSVWTVPEVILKGTSSVFHLNPRLFYLLVILLYPSVS
jgi:hypothetical protein